MNPRLPRLALSVVGKPSFIRKRLEALREFGSNPFHPRRAMFAGLAVTLGIVAVMTVMFGQQPTKQETAETADTAMPVRLSIRKKLQVPKGSTLPSAEQLHAFAQYESEQNDLIMVMDEPIFSINGKLEQETGDRHGFSGIMAFYIQNKGLFLVSLKPFQGALQAGFVKDHEMNFQVGKYKTRILSYSPILVKPQFRGRQVPIYATVDPDYDLNKLGAGASSLPEYRVAVMHLLSANPYFALGEAQRAEAFYTERGKKPMFSLANPAISINDQPFRSGQMYVNLGKGNEYAFSFADDDMYEMSGFDHGRFFLSAKPFPDAQQIATVDGKTLQVQTPLGLMKITSEEPILNTSSGKLWFRYKPSQGKMKMQRESKVMFIHRTSRQVFQDMSWFD